MNIWEKLASKSGKTASGILYRQSQILAGRGKKVPDAKSGERNVGQDFAAEPDAGRKARR